MEFFTTGCKYLNVFLLHFSLLFLMLKTLKITHIFTNIWNRDYEICDSHFGPNICICKLHDGRRRQIVPIFPHSELVQGRFTGTPSSSYGESIIAESFLGEMNFESALYIYSHPLTYRRRGGLPAPGPGSVTEVTVGHGGELPRGLVVVVSEVGAAAAVQPLLGQQLLHPRRGPRQPQHPVQPQQPAQPHKQGVPPPVQPNPDRRNYK